jgi:hypothetical protein
MVIPRPKTEGKIFGVRPVSSNSFLNVVALRCSPPPAPNKPKILHVGLHEVKLTWSDPPFSGVPAAKYQIYHRNEGRNFKEWTLYHNQKEMTSSSYLVLDLPSGVTCQFRINAYNNGGWGAYSEASDEVCPGSKGKLSTTIDVQRSRLVKGGPLAILDRLESNPFHRDEIVWGLSRLRSMAQIASGYKKGNIQRKVALAGIHGIQTFPNDPEMAGIVFYLLGWTLRGPAGDHIKKILVQHNIIELAIKLMKEYRANGEVIMGIAFLRSNMTEGLIPQPPIYAPLEVTKLKTIDTEESDDDDDDDDDDKLLSKGRVKESDNDDDDDDNFV